MRRAHMVALAILAMLVVLPGLSLAETSQSVPSGQSASLVNLELKDVSVKQAIDSLFSGRGISYYVDTGVTGRVVELELRGVTFEKALKALADAAGFTYTVQDGRYLIMPITTAAGAQTAAGPAKPPDKERPQGEAKPAAGEKQGESHAAPPSEAMPQLPPGQVASPNTQIYINNQAPPVIYGQPSIPYGGGYPYTYSLGNVGVVGGYPPVVVAGGTSTYWFRGPMYPPPPGWVSPDVERFLRGQWAIRSVPHFITAY